MKYIVSVLFVVIFFGLSACSSNFDIDEAEVDEVKISFFKDFGSVNEDYHMTLQENEEIKAFVNAINTSKRIKGSVDIPEGDYDLHLIFNDSTLEGFHIWISEESSTGTIMNIKDTEAAYKLTKKSTNIIRDILFD